MYSSHPSTQTILNMTISKYHQTDNADHAQHNYMYISKYQQSDDQNGDWILHCI